MFISILWTFVLGLVFLYTQLLIMPAFSIAGVIPNVLIPWLIYLVWTRPKKHALILAFIIAVMYDTTQPDTFGMHALVFCLLVLAIDAFRKPFEVDSIVAKLLTIGLANLIYSVVQNIIFGMSYGFSSSLMLLSLGGFLYNLLISFVVFWSMQLLSKVRLIIVHD
jgi:rod shape-determining protein MreD